MTGRWPRPGPPREPPRPPGPDPRERARGRGARARRTRNSRRDRPRRRGEPRLSWAARKRLAVEDLAIFRTVSFQDLCEARFGGNEFAARRAVSQLAAAGLVVRGHGFGPRGGRFQVLALTRAGAQAAALRGDRGQRRWHGLGKPADAHHDTAVYRAVRKRIDELRAQGHRVRRIRIDAELRSELAQASESARAARGSRAAERARQARARELHLPVRDGRVHIPDAQVEHERPDGSRSIASIEVVTGSYRASAIRAKAAAGFQLAGSGERGNSRIQAALGGRRISLGETDGRGRAREELDL